MPFSIVGANATISAELYRCDVDGFPREDLTQYVISGTVDWHGDRSGGTAMGCNIRMKKSNLLVGYRDYVTVFLNLTYTNGTPAIREKMGVFSVLPSQETHTANTVEVDVEGYDLTYLLSTSKYLDTKNVATGSSFITYVRNTLAEVGIVNHNITSSNVSLGYARNFRLGRDRLSAVNAMLQAIGYYKIYMARDGYLYSQPYRRLSTYAPSKVYTENDIVDILTVQRPPNDKFANIVVLTKENSGETTLKSIAREDSPAVPWSTAALNREFTIFESVSDAENQAALDALAQERLDNAGVYEKIITLTTLPDPYQEINRTVDLNLTGDKDYLNGRYRLRGWKLGFTPEEAHVEVEMHRVAQFVTGILEPGQGLLPV